MIGLGLVYLLNIISKHNYMKYEIQTIKICCPQNSVRCKGWCHELPSTGCQPY